MHQAQLLQTAYDGSPNATTAVRAAALSVSAGSLENATQRIRTLLPAQQVEEGAGAA